MTRALRLLFLLSLAGCAGTAQLAPREAEDSRSTDREDIKGAKRSGTIDPHHDPSLPKPEDPRTPLAGGPYDKRSGARTPKGSKPAPIPRAVRFVLTKPLPKPLPPGRRPALDGRHKLAVAFVRRGRLITAAARLLRIETALADDDGVRSVTAAPRPKSATVTTVDLDGLARLARKAGRSLLLVSIETTPEVAVKETLVRQGWLLFTRAGKTKDRVQILARFDVHRGATITATTGAAGTGLLARLERAHARLGD